MLLTQRPRRRQGIEALGAVTVLGDKRALERGKYLETVAAVGGKATGRDQGAIGAELNRNTVFFKRFADGIVPAQFVERVFRVGKYRVDVQLGDDLCQCLRHIGKPVEFEEVEWNLLV